MNFFIIIRDAHGDTHAREFTNLRTDAQAVRDAAVNFAMDLPVEETERLTLGFIAAKDAGAARISNAISYTAEFTLRDGILEPLEEGCSSCWRTHKVRDEHGPLCTGCGVGKARTARLQALGSVVRIYDEKTGADLAQIGIAKAGCYIADGRKKRTYYSTAREAAAVWCEQRMINLNPEGFR
jgi:hypothetical protein